MRAILPACLVLALLVRAVIPQGYMLDHAGDDDRLVIRLCGAGLEAHYAAFDRASDGWIILSGNPSEDDSSGEDVPLPEHTSDSCEFVLSFSMDHPLADDTSFRQAFGLPLLAVRVFVSEHHSPVIQAPLPARGPPALL